MRRAFLSAAALFACAAAFAADPNAKASRASFLGEGGGRKASDAATDDYLVGERAPPPGAAAAAPAHAPAHATPAPRQSLWSGSVQSLAANAAPAADGADADEARADAERDYESRVLGAKSAPARAPLSPREAPGSAAAVASARAAGGKLFVSLALDPREAGSLRDAVAGLVASAGFAADARFGVRPGPDGTVLYSGWIPAGRLIDAMRRPGVRSVRVETGSRLSNPSQTSGEFLVGLRLDGATRAREGVDAGVSALSSAAGFRLTRVVGLETGPDGRAFAVVAGVLPLSRLPRALGLAEVVKISPVGGRANLPSATAAAEGGVLGFLGFAARRRPWLVLLTLVLLLSALRAPVLRAAEIFNPDR